MALTIAQWDQKLQGLCLAIKHDYQLDRLVPMYQNKIKRIQGLLAAQADLRLTQEELDAFNAKLARLESKLEATQKEITLRTDQTVKRNPIGTTYYIDFTNGDDANDGLSTGNAWKTLNKYTTDTVRSAGDIAYVRANMTLAQGTEAEDIVFDEDGDVDNGRIEVIGCNATQGIDPWSDGSDVKPIIDFENLSYRCYMWLENYWYFKNLDFKRSDDSDCFTAGYGTSVKFEKCVVRDGYTNNQYGINTPNMGGGILQDCEFYNNNSASVDVSTGRLKIDGCTFNSGGSGTDYGLYVDGGSVEVKDSTFGVTTGHGSADIRYNTSASRVYARNCDFSSSTILSIYGYAGVVPGLVSEDDGQVYGAHKAWYKHGEIEKDTTVTRSGGANSSAKMSPNSGCGLNQALTLSLDYLSGDFKIWCPASSTTVTIYIRGFGWSTFPTASELYVEAEYLDHATNATRSTVASNDVLTDNTTWTAFDVTFTPQQAGFAYITVNLKHYEASSGVYVDVKPVVT